MGWAVLFVGHNMSDPVRIFVGVAPNGADAEACAVLEYTLRKHTSRPLDITWMALSRSPASWFYSNPETGAGWQTRLWPTPFSAFRHAVPAICGFEGRAIYMDDDMIALDDIAKLWDQEFAPGKAVVAKDQNRLCCSLWDCAAARDFVLPALSLQAVDGHRAMRAVMAANRSRVQPFASGNWNCLDGERYASIDDPEIRILHLTSMPHNPAVPHAVRRLAARGARHWFDGTLTPHFRPGISALFDRTLAEAEANGFQVSRYDPGEDFGEYPKNCLKGLVGAKPGWAA